MYEKNSKFIENRTKKGALLPKIDSSKESIYADIKPKNGLFISVFFFQTFFCLFIVLFFIIFKSLYLEKSVNVINRLKYCVEGPTVKEAVGNVASNIKNFFHNTNNGNSNVNNFCIDYNKTDDEKNIKELNVANNFGKKEENSEQIKENEVKTKEEKNDCKKLSDENECEKNDSNTSKSQQTSKTDDLKNKNKEVKKCELGIVFKQPVKGPITSKYGLRMHPVFKDKQDFHNGIDIAVKDGTPIAAVADGVVETISNSERSGNFIYLKHDKDYKSIYAHCSKILAKKGDVVKQGDIIALSGHTGKNITGPHLHVGFKKNGNWVNPAELLPKML